MRFVDDDELELMLRRDEFTREDVRVALRSVRHGHKKEEALAYAETLVPDADYLTGYSLSALVRADITDAEAAREIKKNKAFCTRLTSLLPSILRLFNDRDNLAGLFRMIDDCHGDFHITAASPRKDRQARETQERLTNAIKATLKAAEAIEKANQLLDSEFDGFWRVYHPYGERPLHLSELIGQLRMCAGVGEIVEAKINLNLYGPFKALFLSGNDSRTTVVEYAHHMCTMWNGPKLVTTPGSQFADLCSFLFEAVSGQAEESLSGAINRYARSDERKQWDRDGEEEVSPDDNFVTQKNKTRVAQINIKTYAAMARFPGLSPMAKQLLALRLEDEADQYEAANKAYGPNQVYLDQLNSEQIATMFKEAISSWHPKKQEDFNDLMETQISTANSLEIELGKTRRAARKFGIDG
ncbi:MULTISPECIES: hypothetical protein [unclassified Bradyrhizobium]|uniref:hypothetical protein n=1 Tax=unclassified Bradyrhizobium TaxID=2631580 RepID=UPI001FF15D4F|nr:MULTISPECIES: hypothetical protein [unclassified Bradyrhizobium]MCJ9705260.1 hypothetical protein [Bradyrhizobium sp. SHOUNA76]MCJ9733467.1 hypothetical protein [Bradyrhizobium sp. PRIMUS42]